MLLRVLIFVAALTAFAGAAHAEWREARSKHFIIYSDGSLDELRDFATKVEKFDAAVRVIRRMTDPPLGDHGRLTVYVLRSSSSVARMYGSSRSVAGFYSPRASGSIAFVHREREAGVPEEYRQFMLTADAVFFHEYFHHLMLSDIQAALPRWVIEGFAEYFATATLEKDGSMQFGRAANYRSDALFKIPDVSLEQIVGDSFGELTDDATHEMYGRSWLLTHYLFSAADRSAKLDRYLVAIQSGKPAVEAAREAFGDLKQLDRELTRYVEGKFLTGYRLPASRIEPGPIALRTLTAAESEMMPVRMRSDRGVDQKSAPEVAKQARAVAARYPADAFVQGTLAEAEHDARDFPAAIAAADRAQAANPGVVQGLIYTGRALMELGRDEKTRPTDWKAVRSWFVRANRLEPEFAEPLMLYYLSYRAEGVQPPESAVKGLLYAVLLAPGDEGLRMSAVMELLQRGRLDEAKKAFVPIAYNPHLAAEWRDRFARVMEAMSAGKGAEAIALITAPPPESTAGKKKA
jgi:tetratricopeptide (TPR) repeat protein